MYQCSESGSKYFRASRSRIRIRQRYGSKAPDPYQKSWIPNSATSLVTLRVNLKYLTEEVRDLGIEVGQRLGTRSRQVRNEGVRLYQEKDSIQYRRNPHRDT
jgi:hypothetical protein